MNSEEARFRDLLNEPPFDDSYRDEHRAQLRQQVLEAFDVSQADVSRRAVRRMPRAWRAIVSPPVRRIAAVLLVAVSVYAVFAVVSRMQPTVAFADLVDPILKAKTARFNMTIESKGLPRQTVRMFVLEPGRIRQEMPTGQINIMDGKAGKFMTLNPAQKSAVLAHSTAAPANPQVPDFFNFLRTSLKTAQNDPAFKGEPLGRIQIEDHEAIGYRVKQPHGEMMIWGDSQTGFPILVEMKTTLLPSANITMTDFELDVELDESLFETEPPEGYSLQKLNVTNPVESELINALRLLADDNGGQFPDTFGHSAIAAFISHWVEKHPGKPDAAWNKKVMDATRPLTQGLVFAATLPAESSARYAGKGVKKGDATKAVFWYKPVKSSSYRVVYGDLSVKDENAAPESPNAVPVTLEVSASDLTREIMKRKPRAALPAPEPPQAPRVEDANPAAEPQPTDPVAEKILDEMAGVYASCKSYRDSGIVTTLVVMNNGDRRVEEKPFKTAFVRPDRLRFEYEDKTGKPPSRYIVWSDGKEVQTWWTITGLQKPKTLGLALGGATGVSGGSAATIPALLLPGQTWGSLKGLREAKCTEDGKLENVECFRVEGTFGKHPITLWIAKDSHLLRRIDTQVRLDDFRTEQTTVYDPTIDEDIADKLLEFDPPAQN
jgi:outer membrane lipoprotein-sorting protein